MPFKIDELLEIIKQEKWQEPEFNPDLLGELEADLTTMPDFFERYNIVDKTEFGNGEWQREPDIKIWIDKDTGLWCLIRRHDSLGTLCGYVGIEKSHPAYEIGLEQVNFQCHGGVTWRGTLTAHPSYGFDIPDTIWWIGFDCSHLYDLSPMNISLSKRIGISLSNSLEIYRNFSYVEWEVTYLARQIEDYKEFL